MLTVAELRHQLGCHAPGAVVEAAHALARAGREHGVGAQDVHALTDYDSIIILHNTSAS